MSGISETVMSFCQWASNSSFGHGVRNSAWLFPFVEIFHLLALGLLGGTVLIVNLRLLGVRFQKGPVSELARDVQPLMVGSLVVILVSGFFLFSSEAVKMFGNGPFRIKMIFLVLAMLYTFTVYRKVTMSDESEISPAFRKLAAVLSLVLWFGVGLAGRAIGII
ncbi:MAG: DUF6644 family protein [Candidatus Acidiferrales bacterium]|jgi:hypothetical protein